MASSFGRRYKKRKTIDIYVTGVTQYIAWCEDTQRPTSLDRRSVEEWTAHLLKGAHCVDCAGPADSGAAILSVAVRRKRNPEQRPARHGTPPKLDTKVMQPLTDDELRRLFKACEGTSFRDRRDEALMRFMAETGARAAEVCGMRVVYYIDIKNGVATIVRGKGGRGRVVPFGPQTALCDRPVSASAQQAPTRGQQGVGRPGGGGQSFSYAGMQRTFWYRAKLSSIDRLHPHLLRNTALFCG